MYWETITGPRSEVKRLFTIQCKKSAGQHLTNLHMQVSSTPAPAAHASFAQQQESRESLDRTDVMMMPSYLPAERLAEERERAKRERERERIERERERVEKDKSLLGLSRATVSE